MNFKTLHQELDFNCMDEAGIEDDTTNHFVRGTNHSVACIHQFSSNQELGKQPRWPLNDKREKCQWRCVSINLLRDNRDEVRRHYVRIRGFSPQVKPLSPYLCIFRFLKATAKVWDTATDRNPSHRSLMKSDEFVFADMEIVDIVPAGQF